MRGFMRVMALLGSSAATGLEHVRLRRADGTPIKLHLRAQDFALDAPAAV